MAATDIDICNIALGHLGITQTVSNITTTPTTKEEKAFNRLYAHTRKKLLSSHLWKFARKRAILAETTGVTLDGWLYAYALPANFLVPRKLFVGVREEATDQKAPFDLALNDLGTSRVLVCDLQPVVSSAPILHYTADITDPLLFPPHFDDALSWALADALAMPLRADANMARLVMQRSKMEILDAVGISNKEEQPDTPPEAESIRARY